MQGYFSRIARQSGMRIFPQAAKIQAPTGLETSRIDAPLEHDISVTVPSRSPETGVAASAAQVPARNSALMEKTGVGMGPEPSGKSAFPTPVQSDEKPVLPDIQAALEFGRTEEDAPASLVGKTTKIIRLPQDPGIDAGLDSHAKDSHPPLDAHSPAPGSARRLRSAQPAGSGSTETKTHSLPETGETQEYFPRLAAIMESGNALPANAQSLVLRDVREWVSASHPDAAEGPPERGHVDPVPAGDSARSLIAEAKAIRDSIPSERAEAPEPMARNFELSIGTINVIIDQPENAGTPVPQSVPQPRPPAGTAEPEHAPRSSRLSRSYL